MPRQDPAYLYEQTQERTLHEKNLKIEDLERQADAFQRDVESASARIAALEAENKELRQGVIDEAGNIEYYVGNPSAWPEAYDDEMSDIIRAHVKRLRALLNGGGK